MEVGNSYTNTADFTPHTLPCIRISVDIGFPDANSATESATFSNGRSDGIPDLRIIHYNDVYHVEPGSREPVGGIARFQTLCNHYGKDERYADQPQLLTLFSGDAFNPSLESSVTKGEYAC